MPIRKLKLLPGVDIEKTETLNQTQLAATNLIRFYDGLPQKRGGWQQLTSTPLIGTCSGLHGWGDIEGNPYLAAGTEQRLSVLIAGVLDDITPIADTTNPAVSFSTTTATPNVVTITDAGYSPGAGDWINLLTQVSVGGIVLFGFYQVQSIPGANEYTVQSAAPATSIVTNGGAVPSYTTSNTSAVVLVTLANHGLVTGDTYNAKVSTTVATLVISGPYTVTFVSTNTFHITIASGSANANTTASENGGNARIEYLIPSGTSMAVPGTGYGAGLYGAGLYGGASGQAIVSPRQWSLDNFGQDLIASPTNGAVYYWVPADVVPAAVVDASAPIYNTAVFVMSQAEIIFALGAETGGTQEPLLVRWCDAGDFTDWTATAVDQAGSYSVPQGSRLVGGIAVGLIALLWTDIGVTMATYQGLPFIFNFQPLAVGCGLLGMRAKAAVGAQVMWLSQGSFFSLTIGGGAPMPMECPVWDIMFDNADFTQRGLFVMGANSLNNEFELFFPIKASSPLYVANSVTRGSVKYNFVEHVWDYSISPQLQRTAWEPQSPMGNPIGSDNAGLLQQHELGMDANGSAMLWNWQSGYFDISEGEDFVFVDWLIPDFVLTGNATVALNVIALGAPNDNPVTAGPFYVTASTPSVPYFGVRGRQFAISASSADLGSFNRLGALRYRFAPDGRGS